MLYKIVTYFIAPLSKSVNIIFLRIFSALLVFLLIQKLAYSATVSEPNNFFIYLAKKGNCQSTDTELPCEISVQTGVDFLISIKNCDLLGVWSVSYRPEKSRLSFLLSKDSNGCSLNSKNKVNGEEKKCMLTKEQIDQMTSDTSFITIKDYDENIKKGMLTEKSMSDYRNAVKPLVDCIGRGDIIKKEIKSPVVYFDKK